MRNIKYCVAKVYANLVDTTVSYYAYQNNNYGLHLVGSWRDNDVLWYDSYEEAQKHIMNREGACVMSFSEGCIPKFNK